MGVGLGNENGNGNGNENGHGDFCRTGQSTIIKGNEAHESC